MSTSMLEMRTTGRDGAAPRTARVLHDHVIPCLLSIERGLDAAVVRDLAAFALVALADPDAQPGLVPAFVDTRVDVDTDPHDVVADLPELVQRALLGALAEAVRNAVRHAGAARIVVAGTRTPGGVSLWVEDDGTGADSATLLDGFGVRHSILERLEEVSATARFGTSPLGGLRVTITRPDDAGVRVADELDDDSFVGRPLVRRLSVFLTPVAHGLIDGRSATVRREARALALAVRDELMRPGLVDEPLMHHLARARRRGADVTLRPTRHHGRDAFVRDLLLTAILPGVTEQATLTSGPHDDSVRLTVSPPLGRRQARRVAALAAAHSGRVHHDDLSSVVTVGGPDNGR